MVAEQWDEYFLDYMAGELSRGEGPVDTFRWERATRDRGLQRKNVLFGLLHELTALQGPAATTDPSETEGVPNPNRKATKMGERGFCKTTAWRRWEAVEGRRAYGRWCLVQWEA